MTTKPDIPECPVRARFQDDAIVLEMEGHECQQAIKKGHPTVAFLFAAGKTQNLKP